MTDFILSLSTGFEIEPDRKPLAYALGILRRDIRETLTGSGPENRIRLIPDPSLAEEEYTVRVGPQEILMRCGDDLGGVYALLSLSRRCLGIQPLDWWMQKTPVPKESAAVPCGEWHSPVYAVRRRGWFINDEILFTGWHIEEAAREAVWERVLETLLRCGGNMVIPGTDRQFDGDMLNEKAFDMGLWVTQHHSELLGARMFGRVYPDLQPSYVLHPREFENLWEEAARRLAGRKVIWAVGFRGQGDMAFWHNDPAFDTDEKRGAFVSRIIRRQMEIVRKYTPEAAFCTNLYGEMMGLYRQGFLQVPEDVIKVWADNGYGKMVSRRQNNLNPRTDAMPAKNEPGQNGIYYHVSFYDLQAANHITLLQETPESIAKELQTVLEHGAKDYWIINTGCIRPHTTLIDLISRIWQEGRCDAQEASRAFAGRYYGREDAASLLDSYAKAAVSYGPNDDDLAGDQFYHFTLRRLAHAWIAGETAQPVRSLQWVADQGSFEAQVRRLTELARPGISSWRAYRQETERTAAGLPDEDAFRLRDTLGCMAAIHQCGCESLFDFCQAILHGLRENWMQAFLWTDAALQSNRNAAAAMDRACHGRFAHYFDNDCFVGVRLTGRVLEGVRGWLRLRGDGAQLYEWEMEYLIPAKQRPLLQTHRTAQMTDEELCNQLRGEIRRTIAGER